VSQKIDQLGTSAIFAGPAYNILSPSEIPLSYVMELITDVTFIGNSLQQKNLQL
jgi:hypothetical protein